MTDTIGENGHAIDLQSAGLHLYAEGMENMASDKIRNMKIPYLRDLTTLYYKHLTDCSIVIDKRPSWQTITNIEKK